VQNNKEESSNEAEARHPQHPAHNRGNKSSSWNLVLYLVIVLLLVDKYNYSKREAAVVNGVGDNKDETKLSLQQQHGSDSTTTIDAMQAMDWTIPADILKQRHNECSNNKKTSTTGGFCLTRTSRIGGNWMVDTSLAEYLRDHLFANATVVDLGAGLGHYGKIFIASNSPVKSWVGFDGAMNVQSATDNLVRFMDLTQPHPADERPCVKGDWVLSLEVAEHIPPEFTDHYVRNVRCSCRVGAVVSWAVPSQTGGLGHVNMKETKDAMAAMERWGFEVDEDATRDVQGSASIDHFKRNTIVYRVKKR
jgi:hypothetical protein